MKSKIVAHLIAGYPTLDDSFEVAKGLIEGGAYALEVQIPFSDPSADGPVIEAACVHSLAGGFKVKQGFELVRRIKEYKADMPVYIMSYASIVFTRGVEQFILDAKEAGVCGLIIPDLTVGSDEGLYELGKKHAMDIVPVLVTSVPDDRVDEILCEARSEWSYVALRSGITGQYTEISEDNIQFLQKVKASGIKVMAGFGVSSRKQVELLNSCVDASVAGSYFVRAINGSLEKCEPVFDGVKKAVEALL